ncbi:MAG: DUF3313 domain-containing protein [Myxococcota bacterium]|nr:DUF3313 domain-containing protein [Myxococcota bacterium]
MMFAQRVNPTTEFITRLSLLLLLVFAVSLSTVSCALIGNNSKEAKAVPTASVLVPRSLLHPPLREGYAQLIYAAPNVDWPAYTKVQLNPVTLWRSTDSKSSGLSHKESQALTNYFYQILHETLAKNYEMVSSPGPDTIQITVALTKANEANVFPDVISTVVPHARLLSTLVSLTTEKPIFVGEAAVETRLTDSQTGRILAAGIDQRVGNRKLTSNSFSSWGDVQNIMLFWAQRATYHLCEQQKRTDCIPPGS